MNIMRTELTEINTNIKDLERQSYFMAEERKRLRMTTQRLQDEIQDEKARKLLQRQVTREIKNNVCIDYLVPWIVFNLFIANIGCWFSFKVIE